MYSATWTDGQSVRRQGRSWIKLNPKPKKVALKRLNGSQNMSDEYLNEVYFILSFFIFFLFDYVT